MIDFRKQDRRTLPDRRSGDDRRSDESRQQEPVTVTHQPETFGRGFGGPQISTEKEPTQL